MILILIAPGALTFTCAKDGNATNPLISEQLTPYNAKLAITARSDTTITVNVGKIQTEITHILLVQVAEST